MARVHWRYEHAMLCTCFVFHGNWLAMCHLSKSIQLKEWNNKYKTIFISTLHYLTALLSFSVFIVVKIYHHHHHLQLRTQLPHFDKSAKNYINKQWQQHHHHHHLVCAFSAWHIFFIVWCMKWTSDSLYAHYKHTNTNAIDLSRIFLIYHFDVHLSDSQ